MLSFLSQKARKSSTKFPFFFFFYMSCPRSSHCDFLAIVSESRTKYLISERTSIRLHSLRNPIYKPCVWGAFLQPLIFVWCMKSIFSESQLGTNITILSRFHLMYDDLEILFKLLSLEFFIWKYFIFSFLRAVFSFLFVFNSVMLLCVCLSVCVT